MSFNNIDEFVKQTGFKLEIGEIGIMRPCVGILDPDTDSYICYRMEDDDFDHKNNEWSEYQPLWVHSIAEDKSPNRAYHKGPYLAVLYDEKETTKENIVAQNEAMQSLDEWIGKILEVGYQIKEYEQQTMMAQLMQTKEIEIYKGISDK